MRIFHPTVLSVVLILLVWNVRSGRAQLEGNGAAEAPIPPEQIGDSPLGLVAPGELISFYVTHGGATNALVIPQDETFKGNLWVCPFMTPPEGVEFNKMGRLFRR